MTNVVEELKARGVPLPRIQTRGALVRKLQEVLAKEEVRCLRPDSPPLATRSRHGVRWRVHPWGGGRSGSRWPCPKRGSGRRCSDSDV